VATFGEVQAALRQGKRIRRAAWPKELESLGWIDRSAIHQASVFVRKVTRTDEMPALFCEELMADDWEIDDGKKA